jgi:hypothetical protein
MLFFASFAINSFLHHIIGLYDFLTAERVYIALSIASKTFLAAEMFGVLLVE